MSWFSSWLTWPTTTSWPTAPLTSERFRMSWPMTSLTRFSKHSRLRSSPPFAPDSTVSFRPPSSRRFRRRSSPIGWHFQSSPLLSFQRSTKSWNESFSRRKHRKDDRLPHLWRTFRRSCGTLGDTALTHFNETHFLRINISVWRLSTEAEKRNQWEMNSNVRVEKDDSEHRRRGKPFSAHSRQERFSHKFSFSGALLKCASLFSTF